MGLSGFNKRRREAEEAKPKTASFDDLRAQWESEYEADNVESEDSVDQSKKEPKPARKRKEAQGE